MIRVHRKKLEDEIVKAFMRYEKGEWPVSMRHEADAIINYCTIYLDKPSEP